MKRECLLFLGQASPNITQQRSTIVHTIRRIPPLRLASYQSPTAYPPLCPAPLNQPSAPFSPLSSTPTPSVSPILPIVQHPYTIHPPPPPHRSLPSTGNKIVAPPSPIFQPLLSSAWNHHPANIPSPNPFSNYRIYSSPPQSPTWRWIYAFPAPKFHCLKSARYLFSNGQDSVFLGHFPASFPATRDPTRSATTNTSCADGFPEGVLCWQPVVAGTRIQSMVFSAGEEAMMNMDSSSIELESIPK